MKRSSRLLLSRIFRGVEVEIYSIQNFKENRDKFRFHFIRYFFDLTNCYLIVSHGETF